MGTNGHTARTVPTTCAYPGVTDDASQPGGASRTSLDNASRAACVTSAAASSTPPPGPGDRRSVPGDGELLRSALVSTPGADHAVSTAGANANPEWVQRARDVITTLAATREEFTTDDVWARLDGRAETHERRALGAVVRWAEREGLIRKTDRYLPSTRAECNGRPIAVWASALLAAA